MILFNHIHMININLLILCLYKDFPLETTGPRLIKIDEIKIAKNPFIVDKSFNFIIKFTTKLQYNRGI